MAAPFLIRVGGLVVPAATGSAWNPSDKGTVTLSNGNRTVEANNGITGHGVRGTQGHSTGKRVVEYSLDVNATNYPWWGLVTSSASVTGYMGATDTFVGHYLNAADVFYNNGGGQFLGGYGFVTGANNTGDFTIAVDLDAKLLWVSYNAGDWNNSGTADPATGTGGKDYSGWASPGTLYPYVGGDYGTSTADTWTINTGQAAFAKSAPAGFSAWG